jgi:hypothetical protein
LNPWQKASLGNELQMDFWDLVMIFCPFVNLEPIVDTNPHMKLEGIPFVTF